MPPRLTPGQRITRVYEQAQRRTRATEQRDLSPKEFLDLIDPYGKRSDASAARYMRKLRSGERTGSLLEKRAKRDSGRTVNVKFLVGVETDKATGERFEDVRSANITIPESKSRLDFWKGDRLRKAIDKYLENSFTRRTRQNQANAERYEAIARLPKGSKVRSARRIRNVKYPTEILR